MKNWNILILSLFVFGCNSHSEKSNDIKKIENKTEESFEVSPTVTEVTIGDQIWTSKNLDVSTFRNGDVIMEAKTDAEWEKAGKLHIPAWCYYNNDSDNGENYGKLYNWFAVMDERGLAPIGYHIPNNAEFWVLLNNSGCDYYSNTTQQYNAVKELRSSNEGKFNAILAGLRMDFGIFSGFTELGGWWSVSTYVSPQKYTPSNLKIDDWVSGPGAGGYNPGTGLYVRCIKGESNMIVAKIPIIENELIEYDENEKPKQGEWTVSDASGSKAYKHFKDGLENGERINYYHGKKTSKGNYKNGLQDGEWVSYVDGTYDSNRIAEKGTYASGKKEGEWLKYNWTVVSGQLVERIRSKENYINGVLDGKVLGYDSDGVLRTEEIYKGGDKVNWFEYWENGVISVEGNHMNSNGEREYIDYNRDGKVTHKNIYKNDELISSDDYDKYGNIIKS